MSEGTGDNDSKCLDRYSATVGTTTNTSINYGRGTSVVTVEGVGTFRPYRGQSIYFNEKYFSVQGVTITNPGQGIQQHLQLLLLNQQDQEMRLLHS